MNLLALTATDWVGTYAAALSTALAGWQVYRYFDDSRADIGVTVSGEFVGTSACQITVKAVNRSKFPVTLETVQAQWLGMHLDVQSGFAEEVPPRGYASFVMWPIVDLPDSPDISDVNWAVGRVRIATGEWFTSRPTQLFSCDRQPHEL